MFSNIDLKPLAPVFLLIALRAISFLKDSVKDNAYARPIQGLIAHVDLTEKKVVEIEDHGVVKVPEASARYDKDGQKILRENPKEIAITQPEGVGFSVQDNLISWEGWKLRASIDPIEAQPPLLSIPAILSSLNQTSPHKLSPIIVDGFFTPIIIVLIDPKDGFPLTEIL